MGQKRISHPAFIHFSRIFWHGVWQLMRLPNNRDLLAPATIPSFWRVYEQEDHNNRRNHKDWTDNKLPIAGGGYAMRRSINVAAACMRDFWPQNSQLHNELLLHFSCERLLAASSCVAWDSCAFVGRTDGRGRTYVRLWPILGHQLVPRCLFRVSNHAPPTIFTCVS